MPRKILVVCTTDSMIWNFLIPHIRQLQGYGYTVECACSRTGFYYDELEQKYGLVLHEICFARNPFKMTNYKAYKMLVALIRKENYRIVHCHEPVGGAMGRLAGKRCGAYVIYFSHGFHFFKGAPLKHWLLYYMFEYILSFFTDAIITICKEDYEHAQKLHAKKCYKIPGIGVDFQKFDNSIALVDRELMRKKLHLGSSDIVLITVGELSPRKNQQIVINAVSKITNPDIKLLICGEGDLSAKLKDSVIRNNLTEKVQFLGFRRDIPQILLAADIFIFPSLWEGLGLAGIEAMYSRLPIIGSNRQGIKDYVIEGKTGYLFEPNDDRELIKLIVLLSENSELRRRIGDNARQYIKKYSLKNSLIALEKIYRKEKII